MLKATTETGPRETIDAARIPWGWEQLGYDASGWRDAAPIAQQFASSVALARGTQANGSAAEWQLVPRNIPPMEQAMQWHKYRSTDPGLLWLRRLVLAAVKRMDATALRVGDAAPL